MEKIICPSCGEIITEGPECNGQGIITCDNCNEQVIWIYKDGKTEIKLHK